MNVPDHHLTNDLLVRAIDDELSPFEILLVESHLPDCETCKRRHAEILRISGQIESFAAMAMPEAPHGERDALSDKLETTAPRVVAIRRGRCIATAIALSAAIAAAIVLSVLFAARRVQAPASEAVANLYRPGSTFDVDGETFIRLPYSNPDLPVSAPHIVEMEVPVSSLASAGLFFEPVSNGTGGTERSVLADVLVGLDGQPLGVHVLSTD